MTFVSWRRRAGAAAACALVHAAAGAADLGTSYREALQTDPSLRAAHAALRAGQAHALQGDALLKPQVGLDAAVAVQQRAAAAPPWPAGALPAAAPSGHGGSLQQAALQLRQPLYDPKSVAERQQAHLQAEIAVMQLRQAEQALIQQVAEAYFGVLLAETALQLTQAERAAVTMQRDRAQARFDVGRGRLTDLQESQARLDSVAARELAAQARVAQAHARYAELTGLAPAALSPRLPRLEPAAPQPDELGAWQARSHDDNPRVQLRRQALAIATQEIRKTTLDARPTLALVAGLTLRGGSAAPDSGARHGALVALQFSVPLYAGGAIDARQRESLARRDQAEDELAATRREVRLQVQDAFVAVHTGVARIAALEQLLRSAATAVEATTLARDLGTRTELDVLDAQRRLYAARLELAQARHDHVLDRLRLAAAAGALHEDALPALDADLAS